MPSKTPPTPHRPRRLDRGWLMRHSAGWADEARVLLTAPLRGRMLRTQAVPVQVGRRTRPGRMTSI
jgi:hypothetical protein